MSIWKQVHDREKYGIAIDNFKDEDAVNKLKLSVGDGIRILQECEGWYYGFRLRHRNERGVFPKSYVHLKDAYLEKRGGEEVVVPREKPVVQEIVSTLREWGAILKQLFVRNNENFDRVRTMMYELIDYRRHILSGTLPVDELKELKQDVTSTIDKGNRILDLDLVVRDETGNILNPDSTSAISLYKHHEDATLRLQKTDVYRSQRSVTRYSHSLYVTVKNFVCKIGDDADLLMTLYDAKEGKFISENYVVKWAKEGVPRHLDLMNNLKVLFTDLGSKDLIREKVYLVCQIIRLGAMEQKENDHKRMSTFPRKLMEYLHRPFGIATMDITDFISGKLDSDEEKQHFIPFLQCGERDFLESVIRKSIALKEVSQRESKGQGLWISLKLLHGDLKQVKIEHPHLVSATTAIARKMGFPEIILPGDVRNDLYLTLVQGEFSKGNKTSDKNVEVTVRVRNEKGQNLLGYISTGGGVEPMNEYRSVIYYHEDRPKWFETFKIAIPIEEFSNAHLRFTFKHRSSNDAKDKVEKPFAMSFVKLRQENGTTLKDECHDLLVYKVDHRKFSEGEVNYLSLPSTKDELEQLRANGEGGFQNRGSGTLQSGGLILSNKDSFQISTLVCSTKLTQNVDLLGLLKWSDNQENLKTNLLSLMKVDGEEVVKFLQDVLDALFNILMLNTDSDLYDSLVFEALVFIIGLISDRKYQHFRPVLDLYIKETFSATLAYNKLMIVLKCLVDNANEKEGQDLLLRTMKSLEYIMKFVVRSRFLFAQLNEGKGKQQFDQMLTQLMQSMSGMMLYNTHSTLLVQGACLRFIPTTVTDVITVFDPIEYSELLTDIINNVPEDRLTKQKMMCVNDIVHSDLFRLQDSRSVLLPVFAMHIKVLLEQKEEEELCVDILSDILEVLYRDDVGDTKEDVKTIMLTILRTVIKTVIYIDRSLPLTGNFVAVLIAVLRQMTEAQYKTYVEHFPTRTDILDFVMEVLCTFQDLMSKNVYPRDWIDMIMLQNSVILKTLGFFSQTIRDMFTNPFEYQLWSNFFFCAISFLTQDSLQLEGFSHNKRNKIISRYKDMRTATGYIIRSMWFSLGQHKIRFVPGMVGRFLEMSLIPETDLRKATIPIFFDMMQCEFYSNRKIERRRNDSSSNYSGSDSSLANHNDDHHHGNNHLHQSCTVKEIKGDFLEFEDEMITRLDVLIEGGRGDEQYKTMLHDILYQMCVSHTTIRKPGLAFVKTITCLIERLLEYRNLITDENKENRMSITVNLLEFYDEIDRREMYIRYLYKLCDLHLECDNFTEAAFTLGLHAKLIRWSDEQLHDDPILKTDKYPHCATHRELKERLYFDMIDYFDKGKMWENGLAVCKELVQQYENEIFDYVQLSNLLKRMSLFYDNIMRQLRHDSEYFRVGYYGLGFPAFLQNKVFIYRGKEYERLCDFSSHLQNRFPNAQLMKVLTPPGEDILQSLGQYLQINKVDPVMEDKQRMRFSHKSVDEQVLKYYRVNGVSKFLFSRPLRKGERDSDNEFANLWLEKTDMRISSPLPGILRWFPVISSQTFEVSPLYNAIETMEATNRKLRDVIVAHRGDTNLPIKTLSMLLNGVVDAGVMGGIVNYEKAFFNDDYLRKNPTKQDADGVNRLKDLISMQVPLLEIGLEVHRSKAPENLKPFQDRMEECFLKLKSHVNEKYGQRGIEDVDSKLIASMRRKTLPSLSLSGRFSDLSLNIPDSLTASTSPNKTSPKGRAHSVFVRSSSPNRNSKQKRGDNSSFPTLRRGSAASVTSSSQAEGVSQSQWYDSKVDLTQPIIELNEQLTPHRPLRSEADKRNSRPASGHFRLSRYTPSPSSSTVSLVTTPSSPTSDSPPPLPQKQAYMDYSNVSPSPLSGVSPTHSLARNSLPFFSRVVKNKPLPPLPGKERTPPTPPKKPNRPSTIVKTSSNNNESTA